MLFVTLTRIIKTALVSLWRNRWLSLAATLVMILTLFTISFFITLLVVTNHMTDALHDKVDVIAYFDDSTSKDQIFAIQNALQSRADVKNVNYISKEKALERWKIWRGASKDGKDIANLISDTFNPLPRSLEIKTNKPEDLEKINEFLGSADYKPLIKKISYEENKSLIDRLVKIANFLKIGGWILSLLFLLVSVLIVYNTIRLTIYARSNEIEIMRLVGASDWHVQGPFFVEGFAYGLVASLITGIIFYFAFSFSLPAIESYLGMSNLNSTYLGLSFWSIASVQTTLGVILGMVCSVFAVRKYLR